MLPENLEALEVMAHKGLPDQLEHKVRKGKEALKEIREILVMMENKVHKDPQD